MRKVILDVRERDEFEAEHIENSIHVPLSQFACLAPGILHHLSESELLIMCRSGSRARLAELQILNLGFSDKVRVQVYEGGLLEWKKQGNPTIVQKKGHLPIMRQVQLIAGLIVLISSVMAYWVNPVFCFVSGFVGAGLTLAGSTGFCGMAILLGWMPWNRVRAETELGESHPSKQDCCNG